MISAIFAPILSSFDPQYVDLSQKLLAPNNVHLLGTDQLGRDVLSRLLYGARYSLFLAIIISLLELTIGMFVGLIVGWYQGKLENLFLWIANIILAFPSFLLSLATVGILGHGLGNLIFAIVFVEWVYYAKLMTNLVKSAKKEPYVLCDKCANYGTFSLAYFKKTYFSFCVSANPRYGPYEYRKYYFNDFWLFFLRDWCAT